MSLQKRSGSRGIPQVSRCGAKRRPARRLIARIRFCLDMTRCLNFRASCFKRTFIFNKIQRTDLLPLNPNWRHSVPPPSPPPHLLFFNPINDPTSYRFSNSNSFSYPSLPHSLPFQPQPNAERFVDCCLSCVVKKLSLSTENASRFPRLTASQCSVFLVNVLFDCLFT